MNGSPPNRDLAAAPSTDTGARPAMRFTRTDVAALVLIALMLLLPVPGLWHYQGPPMEEGFMLAFPQRILAGELPHRDFLHLYGPGSLYVLAGVFKVFGSTLGVERAVGLVQHGLLIAAVYLFARRWGRPVGATAALTTLLIAISPLGLSAMAWNGAIALGACSVLAASSCLDRPRRAAAIAAGVCAGAALLYRPDLVVAIGLSALAWWWTTRRDEAQRCPRRVSLLAILSTGLLVVPFVIAVGPGRAFEGMVTQPVFDLRPGRALPVPPGWSAPDGFLQNAGKLRVSAWPLPMPGIGAQIAMWFWLVPLSIAVVGFVAVRNWRRDRASPTGRALTIGAAFGLGLLGQALQRPDTAHLSWVSCWTFAMIPVAVSAQLVQRRGRTPASASVSSRRSQVLRNAAAVAPVAVILLAVIPFYPLRTYADLVGQTFGHNVFGYPIRRGERVFYYGSADAADAAQRIVDRLSADSRPGQTLIVGPIDFARTPYSDAFFYALFPELEPGTRYIEMDPGIADAAGSGLADELRHDDWLIQSRVWSNWDEPNRSRESGDPTPDKVVAAQFCTVLDTGPFRLSRHCTKS
ncbi:MAG: hypothetical protein R2698_11800 [Microthrixaceae bacterium]